MSRSFKKYQSLPACLLFCAAVVGCSGDATTQPSTTTQDSSEGTPGGAPDAETLSGSSAISMTSTARLPTEGELHFAAPRLTDEELRGGWISLFDGVSLFGWEVPADTNWHVEDGTIVASEGEISLLLTPFLFDDFEFRCDFHLEEGGNSGVFLRTAEVAGDPAVDTYELNICDSHPSHGTGSLVGRHVAEDVPPVEGQWHTFRVLCRGPAIQVWLDDAQIVDFTDTGEHIRLTGRIGLQKNQGRIAFRNVFLRPLLPKELFNGENLSGFRVVPGSKSKFDVQNGAIHISDGPGFLETEGTYKDFMMYVEARTNGKSLNSGVFFRAEPGTEEAPSHGYEMQIQNGFHNNDRTQPEDSGTGAIFRRAAARYVVSSDNEWFVATLLAQENQFATWVNGYQVVHWTDDRQPNSNPREGRRDEAGHLSLQGHDPTTDLDFRSIRVYESGAK
ncbi:MAG: DUF1080 domain-containing protein [Planctomycetaceae bacterium]